MKPIKEKVVIPGCYGYQNEPQFLFISVYGKFKGNAELNHPQQNKEQTAGKYS